MGWGRKGGRTNQRLFLFVFVWPATTVTSKDRVHPRRLTRITVSSTSYPLFGRSPEQTNGDLPAVRRFPRMLGGNSKIQREQSGERLNTFLRLDHESMLKPWTISFDKREYRSRSRIRLT